MQIQNSIIRKSFVLVIIFLFVGAIFIPSISGSQKVEYKKDFLTLGPPVYSSTPDWISEDPDYSTGAELADFNLDGWLDLVVADGNDMAQGRLKVYYNNGKGAFPKTADWQSDDLAYNGHLDVADVNGDGWPDVAVSYLGTSSSVGPIARVYLNNVGTLSRSPDWTADITGNSFGVDFGDMNNDGCPDLAVATGWAYDSISYYNYVYLNTGRTLESSASWRSDDADILQGCLWLDADNDSWLDLACICFKEETKIYRNLGGMLETTASWKTSDSSNQDGIMLTYGDVNTDGISDLFTTDNTQLGGSGLFKQYTGFDEGFFETTYSWNYFGDYGSAVSLADVNGDKKLDLATGGWWDFTRIFINEGSGLPTSPTWNSVGTSVVEKIVFGNIGPQHCEHTITNYFSPDGNRRLFHLTHKPIQKILNVSLDGILLDPSEYAFSREHGWITVNTAPEQSLDIVYNYSNSLDMVISNWDPDIGNYLYYNQLLFEADLNCEGNLSWTGVEYGKLVKGSFTVDNIGYPFSSLNWEIESYPDWGNWSFNPENGFNLTPEEGSVVVNVDVFAPLVGDREFFGEIKIRNKDNPDDYDIINVSLIIAKPKLEIDLIKGGLFRVSAIIKNIGEKDADDVNWSIKLEGGAFIGKKTEGSGLDIPANGSKVITSRLILGFGRTVILVNVSIPESSDEKERGGFVLFFFVKVNPGG
jgi:hypothetical protein